jgi:hypothetical protein
MTSVTFTQTPLGAEQRSYLLTQERLEDVGAYLTRNVRRPFVCRSQRRGGHSMRPGPWKPGRDDVFGRELG